MGSKEIPIILSDHRFEGAPEDPAERSRQIDAAAAEVKRRIEGPDGDIRLESFRSADSDS